MIHFPLHYIVSILCDASILITSKYVHLILIMQGWIQDLRQGGADIGGACLHIVTIPTIVSVGSTT